MCSSPFQRVRVESAEEEDEGEGQVEAADVGELTLFKKFPVEMEGEERRPEDDEPASGGAGV